MYLSCSRVVAFYLLVHVLLRSYVHGTVMVMKIILHSYVETPGHKSKSFYGNNNIPTCHGNIIVMVTLLPIKLLPCRYHMADVHCVCAYSSVQHICIVTAYQYFKICFVNVNVRRESLFLEFDICH